MYQTLFNINVYHSYFLDEGERVYFGGNGANQLSEEEKKNAEKAYELSEFLSILPTEDTQVKLKDHRLLYRKHAKGIRVLAETTEETEKVGVDEVPRYSPVIPLADDLELTFYFKVHDAFFENYSKLIERAAPQLYFVSNTSSSAGNVFDSLANPMAWEAFLLTEKETRALCYQLETAKQQQLHIPNLVSIANMKTTNLQLVTANDLEAIENKITNAIALTEEEQEIVNTLNTYIKIAKNKGIIGVLQLKMKGNNATDLTENVTVKNTATGLFDTLKQCLIPTYPELVLYIENKATFWRYKAVSSNLVMTTKTEKPLTKNGRVEIAKQDLLPQPQGDYFFPNPTPENIKKEAQSYYSEIFI